MSDKRRIAEKGRLAEKPGKAKAASPERAMSPRKAANIEKAISPQKPVSREKAAAPQTGASPDRAVSPAAAVSPEKAASPRTAVPAETPLPASQPTEEFVKNMMRTLEATGQIIAKVVEDKDKRNGAFSVASGMADSGKLFAPIFQYWMNDAKGFQEAQSKLNEDMIELWGRTYKRFLGEKVEPMIEPSSHDPRFRDKEWTDSAFFDFLKQAYLLAGKWAEDMIHNASTVDAHTKHRAEFYVNQIVSALSPSNFPFTNPEVIRATTATGGKNLAQGMTHLLEDLDRSGELLRIRQTDMSAFEVGKNLAVTPGKVVWQNELFQLIQYTPTTGTVHEVPMLIVPPWINKFYILDLTPPKSFIKWMVDQGFTVFLISWVNPDERLASKSFEDYMLEGVMEAVGAVLRVTGQPHTNTLGYCVGGTLLACTLAYMAAKDDHRINSATLFTAQTDFTKAGDLLVFIDEEQLRALEDVMAEKGFLDGARMAATFNALRPKDLIWPYVVNNYLLGKQPFPFDLLYWNADSTRMPAANHSFYLREFYKNNALAQGLLKLGGVTLDLGKITVPIYSVAAKEDHIAPAQSVLNGAKLVGGPVRFVLAGSGHIAGVINPPAKRKYQYWILEEGDAKLVPTIEAFVSKASEILGSWWPDYKTWLSSISGGQVAPPEPGGGVFTPIEDAPGSYVRR